MGSIFGFNKFCFDGDPAGVTGALLGDFCCSAIVFIIKNRIITKKNKRMNYSVSWKRYEVDEGVIFLSGALVLDPDFLIWDFIISHTE